MIRLNKNPVEGSAVRINVSFRDSFGAYYVPSELTYTLLALNSDKESWSVVSDYYKVPINPESSVNITIPKISLITGTELQRKIIVEWSGYVDGEYTDFVDEVNFDVQPRPYITDAPEPPEPQTVYVRITDVSLQVGSLDSVPTTPVFKIHTSLPVMPNGIVTVSDGTESIECLCNYDSSYTVITATPEKRLEYEKEYTLTIDGYGCRFGDYVMEKPYNVNFVTAMSTTYIEENKEVTVTENGVTEIVPDAGYDGIGKVTLTTALPLQNEKSVLLDTNQEIVIEPDDDNIAMKSVRVKVELPVEEDKEVTFIENGDFLVEPDDEFRALKNVKVKVDIPVELEKNVSVTQNGYREIVPDSGKSYIGKVNLNVDIPIQENKDVEISTPGTVVIEPDAGYTALKKISVNVNTEGNIALYGYKDESANVYLSSRRITSSGTYNIMKNGTSSGFVSCSVSNIGGEITLDYEGSEIIITRDSASDLHR